jgi:glyoxylase I family protein
VAASSPNAPGSQAGAAPLKATVEHLALAARDPVALADWYRRVLGAVVLRQLNPQPPAFLLRLPGGLWLEIYQAVASSPQTSDNTLAGWRHLALRVDSIESARAVLEAQGVRFVSEIKPAGGGGRVLFFEDGEGNLLHLVERPQDWSPSG